VLTCKRIHTTGIQRTRGQAGCNFVYKNITPRVYAYSFMVRFPVGLT